MAFETNLSAKDKKTIAAVLSAGAVFAFGWFAIRPVIIDIGSTTDDILQAQALQNQYKSKIMSLTPAEAVFEEAVDELYDSTADYYPMMRSSEIDRMMTSYMIDFGLYPEDLYITMPTSPVVEVPYIYSDVEATSARAATPTPSPTPKPTSSGSGSSAVTQVQVEGLNVPYDRARASAVSTASSSVYCVELTYVVVGSPEACQALIDDLSVKPSIRLTGFEWSELDQVEVELEDGTTEMVDNENVRLRVEFNLYMVDIADYEAMVSDAVINAAEAED